MQKSILFNLIKSHYENDNRIFDYHTDLVIEEFLKLGDKEIVKEILYQQLISNEDNNTNLKYYQEFYKPDTLKQSLKINNKVLENYLGHYVGLVFKNQALNNFIFWGILVKDKNNQYVLANKWKILHFNFKDIKLILLSNLNQIVNK